MPKTLEEVALVAAEWWADKVCHPKFDNGDNSNAGGMCMIMAHMLVKPVEEDSRARFVSSLKGGIVERLTKYDTMTLDVDYAPDMVLSTAASEAGVSGNNFPWKTCMWLSHDHVSVSYGYRAETQYLYASSTYWTKRIDDAHIRMAEIKGDASHLYIRDEAEREKRKAEDINYYEVQLLEYKKKLKEALAAEAAEAAALATAMLE